MTELKVGRTDEIKLCERCKGKGHDLYVPDPNRDEAVKRSCPYCNGTGRLRWTTTVEVEPYG